MLTITAPDFCRGIKTERYENKRKTIKTEQAEQTGKSNDRSGGNYRYLFRGVGFNRDGVMKTRVCTKCGEEKPETAEYFYRAKTYRGGLNTMCKVCWIKYARKWRAENPEKQRESVRRWQAKNPEKNMEAARRWRAENPEKEMERKRRWKAENPEKQRESVRRWYAENPEKAREAEKRWRAENPEKVKEAALRRRNTLAPNYLKQLISNKYDISHSEIGDELIEAKRRELKYYRQFKQLKQLKK